MASEAHGDYWALHCSYTQVASLPARSSYEATLWERHAAEPCETHLHCSRLMLIPFGVELLFVPCEDTMNHLTTYFLFSHRISTYPGYIAGAEPLKAMYRPILFAIYAVKPYGTTDIMFH
jgi:hypothetical protein